MEALKVRKNFLFDKDIVEKAEDILKQKHKNFTEALSLYLKALSKEPKLLDDIEKIATKRTGSFIGILDNKLTNENFKAMKREKNEDFF